MPKKRGRPVKPKSFVVSACADDADADDSPEVVFLQPVAARRDEKAPRKRRARQESPAWEDASAEPAVPVAEDEFVDVGNGVFVNKAFAHESVESGA